tara:strand:- start:511 stop:1089 length:579 start_codon:yes stop_codon:yes gene_type:complete
MVKKFKIFVFRHGRSTDNVAGRFSGHRNARLTKNGIDNAKMVAERLKRKRFKMAYQTSLIRSKATLNEVLKFHPECEFIIQDDRMIERDYGSLTGKKHLAVMEKSGFGKYDEWHRDFDAKVPGSGENFADVEKRVREFIKDLKKMIKKEKCNVAISAHGNSIRLFRKVMEGLTKKETEKLVISYDGFYEYSV